MKNDKMRTSVKRFALNMETVLRENDHKFGWRDLSFSHLLIRIKGEIEELEDALINQNKENIVHECADIANFLMMIVDNVRHK